MAAQKKYPDELRERAVKMVLEIREREGKGRGELARVACNPPGSAGPCAAQVAQRQAYQPRRPA